MQFRRSLLLGTMLAAVGWTGAMAGGPDGLYLRAEGGYTNAPSQEGSVGDPSGVGSDSFHTSQDNGFIVGSAIGYKWGAFRLEANLDFAKTKMTSITEDSAGGVPVGVNFPVSNKLSDTSGMVNFLYDFEFGWPVTPYVGVGVGVGNLDFGGAHDLVFQYQPMVGLNYFLTPTTAIGLEYRFVGTSQGTFGGSIGGVVPFESHETYQSHNILASLTLFLGAPAAPPPPTPVVVPPPAPVATPAPAQEVFLVFFNFDRSDLTDAGRQVVDAAAAAFKSKGFARIEVTGYTDLSGTQAYNLRLSERRAKTVSAALAADGVPGNAVGVAWHGKENPRVPTPDGVREPQNRRVEIVLP